VSWAFLVLFVVQAAVHMLFALSLLNEMERIPTILVAAAITPTAAGVVYWLMRRRFDRRIEALLTQPAERVT
jgi:NhaP-type Na+/H+ or K+/H+ antiporter